MTDRLSIVAIFFICNQNFSCILHLRQQLQGRFAFRLSVKVMCLSEDGNLTDAAVLAVVRSTTSLGVTAIPFTEFPTLFRFERSKI